MSPPLLLLHIALACARDRPADPPGLAEPGGTGAGIDTSSLARDSAGGDSAVPPGGADSAPDDTEPGDTAPDDSPLVLGQRSACETPQAAPTWREVGERWGLVGVDPSGKSYEDGGAIAVDDFDGDGDLDILLGWRDDPSVLYLRDGDAWLPQTLDDIDQVITINLADIDGDGRRDLLLGRQGSAAAYAVTGAAEFTALPLPDWELRTHIKELAPADIDGDGDTDLYALVRGGAADTSQKQDAILWNTGDGSFQLDREAIPEDQRYRHGFDATWFDWDLDGDMDVYVANDLGGDYGPDALLENRDGELVDASTVCACEVTHAGMSVDYADFNRDGYPDLYVSDAHINVLLQSVGGGSYADAALALNAALDDRSVYMTWGAIFADYDNDGYQDILAARGDYAGAEPAGYATPTVLDFDGSSYTDVSADLGLDAEAFSGIYRAVIALDLNGDGLVDPIYTQVLDRPLVFLSQGCTAESWLEVEGPDGARVEVVAGEEVFVDWIASQSALAAAHAPLVHIGLGRHDRVDRLTVYTPGGEVYTRDRPFEARRRVSLRP